MDFGTCPNFGHGGEGTTTTTTNNSNKHKWCGSGDGFRELKVAKVGDTMLLHRSTNAQQMLSFSTPTSQAMALPYYHSTKPNAFSRNTGVHGVVVSSGLKGPFTPSQWMELEHQALIYKYIIANVPIPSYLLNPIRKALESAGFGFSGLRHNALAWGGLHLGFSNTDPEPGRCRRTDGKKWRCSRDAVPDQKYCERHLNRGRHRSRKPVEGHLASGTTTSTAKLPPVASSKLPPTGCDSNNLGLSHHQLNHFSRLPNKTRSLSDKQNLDEEYRHTTFLHETSSKTSLKEQNTYEESTIPPEFGLVCSDSLLNPLDRSSSFVNDKKYSTPDNPSDHGNKSHHALRQFMDDWPKNQERSTISWPEVDLQPESTNLSISIPSVTSDFMSSTTSSTGEKPTISSLGMSINTNDHSQRQTSSWIPISWEPSMGGPLGEVLHTGTGECKTTMALNLMEGWDNSPRLASSPTGVLQRYAFGSLSNSSAGSSPRAESSKTLDGASLCNGGISGLLSNLTGEGLPLIHHCGGTPPRTLALRGCFSAPGCPPPPPPPPLNRCSCCGAPLLVLCST